MYRRRQLAQIAARWDAKADRWEHELDDPACHLNEDAAYERFIRAVRGLVRRRRGFCARHGLVDAGCGTGLVLSALVSSFAWGVGVDISRRMVRIAREKKLPNTRFLVGDVFSLPAPCHGAGAVCSRGVLLSHYGARQSLSLLKGFRRILGPGGFLVCDFLNAAARGRYQLTPRDKAYFLPRQVCGLARKAGFAVARVIGHPSRRVLLLHAKAG